jgi:M6 family metalloprotease-like protein
MRTLILLILSSAALAAEEAKPAAKRESAPAPRPAIVLKGYRNVTEAIPGDPKKFAFTDAPPPAGFLGIEVDDESPGRPRIADVQVDSPADEAGLKPGDIVRSLDGKAVTSARELRDALRGRNADEELSIAYEREGKTEEVSAKLRPLSKPFKPQSTADRPILGIQLAPAKDGGVEITSVTPGGAADRAGLKAGDIIRKINKDAVTNDVDFRDIIGKNKVGDTITLLVKKAKEEIDVRATLGSDQQGRRVAGWDDRLPRAWGKDRYKLAIIGIEYADVKHNPKIGESDWNNSMFSLGRYFDQSSTGQRVYGSMSDYYKEISYGKLKIDGEFVGWVEVSKKRSEYSTGSGTSTGEKTGLFNETFDKLLAKKGKLALDGYDGVFFLYAGERVTTTRGGLYWPHRANFRYQGKNWPYFIVQEGGRRMTDISVFCHEFGHMLGLPDLYARPEVPGQEGVGSWCAMSQQNGGGRPQHFSAWCKQELGWIKPKLIDPRVKQKLVLAPIEDNPAECLKIPVRADGSEYLLLENRKRKGFDADLPAEGLLIWRVIPGNRGSQPVFLEESHGIQDASGPRSFTGAVPFPSPANNSFTPFTTPSSKSQLGGGYDVWITNIKRLHDGRIALQVGYEFQ